MKRILLLFSILSISCSQDKIKISPENHLDYLGVKGKVKQMDIEIFENELNYPDYIPKQKGINTNVGSFISSTDVVFNQRMAGISPYNQIENLFDSKSISLDVITHPISYFITDYHLEFNENGYLTKLIGKENRKQVLEKNFEYDSDNRLISFEWRDIYFSDDSDKMVAINYSFEYDGNLLEKKSIKWEDGFSKTYNYHYVFEDFSITVNEEEVNSNGEKNSKTSKIILDKNLAIKKIEQPYNDIEYKDFRITKISKYNRDGEIMSDFDYNYQNSYPTVYKETKRFENSTNYSKYIFDYNSNNSLESIDVIDQNDLLSGLIFDYEYDQQKNWTNSRFALDQKYYENALKSYNNIKNKRERIESRLSGYDKIRYSLDNKELVDAKINLKYTKDYSSQINIERDLIYY